MLNGDYYINRDLMWNMPGKKPGKEGELLQKISLNDLYTNEWMAQVHTTRRTEHERAMEEKRSEGIAILQQDVFTKIEQPEFMLNPNNTKDDVKAGEDRMAAQRRRVFLSTGRNIGMNDPEAFADAQEEEYKRKLFNRRYNQGGEK